MNASLKWRRMLLFAYACLLLLWSALTIGSICIQHLEGKLFFFPSAGHVQIADFVQFYKAGKMSLSADRFHVYDEATQLKWTNELVKPYCCQQVFFMQGVPFLFPLMVPFALLPMTWSYWAVLIPSFLLALFAVFKFSTDVAGGSEKAAAFLLCGLVASVPALITFLLGQLSWFLLALFCFFFWSMKRDRHWLAGCSLALLAFKPQYALLLWIPLAAGKRWRALLIAAAAECALLVLAALTIGWQNVLTYPSVLLHSANAAGNAPELMVNARALLSAILPAAVAFKVALAMFVLAGLSTWYCWRSDKFSFEQCVAITVLFCLVASPHSHIHDCVLLAIPAAIALARSPASSGSDAISRFEKLFYMVYPPVGWVFYLAFPTSKAAFMVANFLLLGLAIFRLKSATGTLNGRAIKLPQT